MLESHVAPRGAASFQHGKFSFWHKCLVPFFGLLSGAAGGCCSLIHKGSEWGHGSVASLCSAFSDLAVHVLNCRKGEDHALIEMVFSQSAGPTGCSKQQLGAPRGRRQLMSDMMSAERVGVWLAQDGSKRESTNSRAVLSTPHWAAEDMAQC